MPTLFAAATPLDLPPWSVAPFVLLLLTIALLPLAAPHWWHRNRNKAIIAAVFGVPVVLYLAGVQFVTGQRTLPLLGHELVNYGSFIVLLGSLYVVAGGIVVEGDLQPTPTTNTLFLLVGAMLANLIGTTGASVLLIRPLLRINKQRRYSHHIPIFFIFTVSNLGGLLTPLGDPPLFLGFLNGVPFEWTLRLWPVWLVTNLSVLLIFYIWDTLADRREGEPRGRAAHTATASVSACAGCSICCFSRESWAVSCSRDRCRRRGANSSAAASCSSWAGYRCG